VTAGDICLIIAAAAAAIVSIITALRIRRNGKS